MTFRSAKFQKPVRERYRSVRWLWQCRALPAILALASVAMLNGCAGVVGANGPKSSSPISAAIQVTPGNLNFGSTVVGKKVSQTVTVANTGKISVTLSKTNLSSSQFSVSGLALPLTLPAGQSSNFQVWFEATSAGNVTGSFTVQTDTGVSSGQVALAGTAMAPPQINASSTSLNLGSATIGTTATGTLTLTNPGGTNLLISLISVSGGSFGVSGISTPSTLTPGGSVTINVSFSPAIAGSASGSISVTSNDPQNPTTIVTLTGTGTSTPVSPSITTSPTNQTVTAGQTATFMVVAAGTAPLSYQWQRNGVNIAGATAASYTAPATTASDNGSTFAVVVSNSVGTVTSAAATLTVSASPVGPSITTSPTNQTVTPGQTATFTVVAAGTAPLSYQWQKNGVNIAGATAASYTTPATTASDNGSTFAVVVSNSVGTVTSPAATLTVSASPVGPSITTSPTNQTVTTGQTATFTVVAAGTAPLSYQWQKNGVNIAGATAASYTTPATTASNNGSTFAVVVSNTVGTTSAAATLTVSAASVGPSITTSPTNQTVTAGQTATFTVVAAGTAPLSYQWQKNGVNIAGATAASYTTPATTASDNGSTFAVVVSNSVGTLSSAAATLTVSAAPVGPSITTSPTNQTVTAGQTATFTVVAAGTAPLSYQWQKNGANIAGATAASYTTPATTASDSGSTFAVVVSNSVGTTSAAATLTVSAASVGPSITTSPTNQTVTAGQTATFTVVAAGTAPLSYQWQKNGVNIAGATAASYTTPVTTASDNGSTFAVVVSNTVGTLSSAAATLTVSAAPVGPSITTSPTNQTVTAGQTATFTVVAAGTAPLSYQWQKNGVNIAGATAASYTTPATTASDSGSTFAVVVSNTVGTDQRSRNADSKCCTGRALDHNLTHESDRHGGTDSNLHGGCGRDSTTQLPVAEERREHRRSYCSELHHAGNNRVGQWIDVCRGGEQHGGHDQRSRNADSKRCIGRALDHNLTHESDRHGGTDSNLHGGCGRDSTAQLPVAEERREHRRSYCSELHHAGNNRVGQWIDVCRGGEQLGGHGDQCSRDADGECCSGRALDHNLTHESDCNGRTDSNLHGGCWRNSTAQLPVAEKRREHRRSYCGELHHAGDNHIGQWIDLCCGGEQHAGHGDQCRCDADGESCPGRALDHSLTHESDCNGRTDSNLHGGCWRNSTAQLPVAEKRREHRRSYCSQLHHTGSNRVGQWIERLPWW